jgi:hypothetical protein
MAIQMIITPGELERQANLAYEGKMMRVFLCYDPENSMEISMSVAECEAFSLAGGVGGYEDFSVAIPQGFYNTGDQRYEIPAQIITFGGIEQGFTYDTIVVQIASSNYPHSIIQISEPQSLTHGQLKNYRISLLQDD